MVKVIIEKTTVFGWVTFLLLSFLVFFVIQQSTAVVYGPGDVLKGKTLYETRCMHCHGNRGHGDGMLAKQLDTPPDDIYQELSDPLAIKWELIGSVLEGDNGEGGLMPPFKSQLSAKDIYHIFSYIEQVNQAE